MTTTTTDLIHQLEERRRNLGISDEKFARLLGVSRSMWSQVRSGNKEPGERFIGGVMREFPTLTDACVVYLRDR